MFISSIVCTVSVCAYFESTLFQLSDNKSQLKSALTSERVKSRFEEVERYARVNNWRWRVHREPCRGGDTRGRPRGGGDWRLLKCGAASARGNISTFSGTRHPNRRRQTCSKTQVNLKNSEITKVKKQRQFPARVHHRPWTDDPRDGGCWCGDALRRVKGSRRVKRQTTRVLSRQCWWHC